jgi:hypothetical protein
VIPVPTSSTLRSRAAPGWLTVPPTRDALNAKLATLSCPVVRARCRTRSAAWRRVETRDFVGRGMARNEVLCLNPAFINRLKNGPQFEKVST